MISAFEHRTAVNDLRRTLRWRLAYAAHLDRQARSRASRGVVIRLAKCLAEAERISRREARA